MHTYECRQRIERLLTAEEEQSALQLAMEASREGAAAAAATPDQEVLPQSVEGEPTGDAPMEEEQPQVQ